MARFKIQILAVGDGHAEIEADSIEEARELIADLSSGDLEFIDGPDLLPIAINEEGGKIHPLTPEEMAAIYSQISATLSAIHGRRSLADLDLFDAIDYLLDQEEAPGMSATEAMASMIRRSMEGEEIPAMDGLDYSDFLEWVREDLAKIGAIKNEEEEAGE